MGIIYGEKMHESNKMFAYMSTAAMILKYGR